MKNLIFLLMIVVSFNSCGTFRKAAIGTTSGMLYKATEEMETDGNWESLKTGAMGNIKFMEGLLYLAPGDDDLLASLTKSYAGYAFGVYETLYLGDKLAESDNQENIRQAIYHYSKALNYGLEYLKEQGVTLDYLKKNIGDVKKLLKKELGTGKQDLETAFFTGQALGSLINLQKTNMSLVTLVPIAKGMFDYVCDIQPDFNHGACGIFYGSYEASRPKMLGGNPAKGKEIFLKTIKEHPHNWFARAAYLEHYVVPMVDEDEYEVQKEFLSEAAESFDKELKWDPFKKETEEAFKKKSLRVFQALGIKRFQIISKYEKEIF